jgi:hypothetical protein
MKSAEDKFLTVIEKNTFYFFNQKFEENYEGYISSLKETLSIVKNEIETEELKKEILERLLKEKEDGLKVLLALTGFSSEYTKRATNIIRAVDHPELNALVKRYKEKENYSGMKGNNPETVIAKILEKLGLTFETCDLKELISSAPNNKRTMDFIIPNKKNPSIIVESSFLATTSSEQDDEYKTEISIDALIKEHYPKAKFIGFVDGIGWYVRKGDLKRMVTAYDDVFTFHIDELKRFEKLLTETLKK